MSEVEPGLGILAFFLLIFAYPLIKLIYGWLLFLWKVPELYQNLNEIKILLAAIDKSLNIKPIANASEEKADA
jgi:hypothetical protein